MKKLIIIAVLVLAALPAFCDGTGTFIQWPQWTVTSTEDAYLGHKHTSFPLTYLFDGDPATAWVFSGTGKHDEGRETGYGLTITRGRKYKPLTVDSVWIMNGYNKSRELFLRNNRIAELKVYVNSKYLKTVSLDDVMGWHKISIPRQPVKEIKLQFSKLQKGPDNDICVSEIALYDKGTNVDLKMPNAVIYSPGSDCGDGQDYYVIGHTGRKIARHYIEFAYAWSPSGRYIAGSGEVAGEKCDIWVADSTTGKIIMRRSILRKNNSIYDDIAWKGEHSLKLELAAFASPNDVNPLRRHMETIKVADE